MCFHMPIWACGTPSTARTTYPKPRSRQTCCESASPGIHIVRLRRGTCGEVWREPRESDLSAELHQFRVRKKTRFFRCAIQIEKAGIEQTSGFDFTHCRKQRLFQMRMIALQFGKDIAQRPANCPRFLRTTARDDGCPETFGKGPRQVFGHIKEGADQAEIAFPGVGDRRQCAQAASKHRIAKKGFAEIVRGMAESDDICAEISRNLIDRATAEPAAQVTSVIGLLLKQPQRRPVLDIGPINTTLFQVA